MVLVDAVSVCAKLSDGGFILRFCLVAEHGVVSVASSGFLFACCCFGKLSLWDVIDAELRVVAFFDPERIGSLGRGFHGVVVLISWRCPLSCAVRGDGAR